MNEKYKLTSKEKRRKPPYGKFNAGIAGCWNQFFVELPKISKFINITVQWIMLISLAVFIFIIIDASNIHSLGKLFVVIIYVMFISMIYAYNIHVYRPSLAKGKRYSLWLLSVVGRMRSESDDKINFNWDEATNEIYFSDRDREIEKNINK